MLVGPLPDRGAGPEEVRAALAAAAADDVDWRAGRGWSLVYDRPPHATEAVTSASADYAEENALSHGAFPSVAAFESAAVRMVASVVCPGVPAYGVFTSGGTESVLLALKALRDARPDRRTVVVPSTAHPAYWKAAHLLGLEHRVVPVLGAGPVDAGALLAEVDAGTLVVGLSAPGFPTGAVDPIAEIACAAADRGAGVHVDAALGGMVLPFLDGAPPFALDVPGVTSVSVDLHKYGYAAKGAGVLLFADADLRRAAYFTYDGWAGGPYATGSVLGTRSAGPAAAACAALLSLGREGYAAAVASVTRTATALQELLAAHGLHVLGTPAMSVFAVTGEPALLHSVATRLRRRGWSVDVQLDPLSLHFVVFPRHADVLEQLRTDLAWAAEPPFESGDVSSYGVVVRAGGDLAAALDERYGG